MAQTLIVFDQNPESLTFYVVPSDHKVVSVAGLLHGLYVNGDELTARQEKAFTAFSKWAGDKGKQFVQDRKKPMTGLQIERVLHLGFLS